MAVAIVDLLELVEINAEDRHLLPGAAAAHDCVFDPLEEQDAIRQSGQGIVDRGRQSVEDDDLVDQRVMLQACSGPIWLPPGRIGLDKPLVVVANLGWNGLTASPPS
jgi:hypothetical protein